MSGSKECILRRAVTTALVYNTGGSSSGFSRKLDNSAHVIPIKGLAHVYARPDQITLFGIHVNTEVKNFHPIKGNLRM